MSAAPFSASHQEDFVRLYPEKPSGLREPLQRDRDRIIHASYFRKLSYKTQVFMCYEGDYYRTRLSHSLEVAQVARTLARHFQVNEDLAETLALAHDLGHTPFGHAGEDALNTAMASYGGFDHNAQTLRIVTLLEKRYAAFPGLNLTWDVLEGLVKHNGPLLKPGESVDTLPYALKEYATLQDLHWQSYAGFEAQLVPFADDIAYNTHDLEDGLRARFFTLDDLVDIPILGPIIQKNRALHSQKEHKTWSFTYEILRQFMGAMINNLIEQTQHKLDQVKPGNPQDVRHYHEPLVVWSMSEPLKALRQFFYTRMYHHPRVIIVMMKAKNVIRDLFHFLHTNPDLLPEEMKPLHNGPLGLKTARCICDHIASMTDRSALEEHRKFFDLDRL